MSSANQIACMMSYLLYERHQLTAQTAHQTESGPRLGWRIRLIIWRREPSKNGLGSIPPLSAHLLPRRLAALKSVSLAHVTGLASSTSAAASICCFSASVIGISMAAVLRSLAGLGGLPIRLFPMPLNIYKKSMASTLAMQTYYLYNKCRQRKTLRSVGTRLRATRTGFRQIPAW